MVLVLLQKDSTGTQDNAGSLLGWQLCFEGLCVSHILEDSTAVDSTLRIIGIRFGEGSSQEEWRKGSQLDILI